ncbi:MAG: hypothetical protein RSD49_06520 [Hafnia sp.]
MEELKAIATHTRMTLEAMLTQSLGHHETTGACLYASFLCHALISKFTSASAIIRGGDGLQDGGVFVGDRGYGHYWVEATHEDATYVIDISADQFGLEQVIVAPIGALPARYIPGNQRVIDGHVRDLKKDIENDQAEQNTTAE